MEVVPAIDIRGGKCVQLYQGDYERETVFSDDPRSMASHWVSQGATRLHVIDLDGARSGEPVNIDIVVDIAASAGVPVQYGGGVRSTEVAREVVSRGIGRVIIGTVAIDTPGLIGQTCRELGPDAVVVGVDARDGYVATEGWTKASRVAAADLVGRVAASGVRRFMYTDISRDGTLTEPNYRAIGELLQETELAMLVAGGVSSVDHVRRLSRMGVEGAIIGTAVYTGDVDLREAIAAVESDEQAKAAGREK
jgi:phosphoribosylformimino-5-aminoimidazole carboxamide ribotide isomerase